MVGALRTWIVAGIVGGGLALTAFEANAQSLPKDAAARVELYPIPTLTLSARLVSDDLPDPPTHRISR